MNAQILKSNLFHMRRLPFSPVLRNIRYVLIFGVLLDFISINSFGQVPNNAAVVNRTYAAEMDPSRAIQSPNKELRSIGYSMLLHQFTEIHPSWGLKVKPNTDVLVVGAPNLESKSFASGAVAFFDPHTGEHLGSIGCPTFENLIRLETTKTHDEDYLWNKSYWAFPPSPLPKDIRRFGATVDAWGNQLAIGNQGAPDGGSPPVILIDVAKEKAEGIGFLAIAFDGWGILGSIQRESRKIPRDRSADEYQYFRLQSDQHFSTSRGFFIEGRLHLTGVQLLNYLSAPPRPGQRYDDNKNRHINTFEFLNNVNDNFKPEFRYMARTVNSDWHSSGSSDGSATDETTPPRFLITYNWGGGKLGTNYDGLPGVGRGPTSFRDVRSLVEAIS